ncbi:hypothetical protein AVEN_152195-1 [Araneus ventricosus]|uniref:Uncharacterized protein n=1 Tax=Araneus ventricosus TaxID=182803 RepID=A0A4Y2HKU7_ARAVE|nr:hypothetical protein AVEN_152195-1 [Araneus ventricosus]
MKKKSRKENVKKKSEKNESELGFLNYRNLNSKQVLRTQTVESMQLPDQSVKIRIHDVMPSFNPKEDEISLFLVLFEHQAKIMNIPTENQRMPRSISM